MSGITSNKFCFQLIRYRTGPSINKSISFNIKNDVMTMITIDKTIFALLNLFIVSKLSSVVMGSSSARIVMGSSSARNLRSVFSYESCSSALGILMRI